MAIADELIAILGYELTGQENARKFEKTVDGLSKKLDKFAISAGKVAGYASVALASGFGFLGKSVIETSAQFETYQATLETIEGSAEKARASLDWIAEFGKTTPYDVAQVTDAFVKLKAYGIDPIADEALRTLGDTAAAMGKPLTQAVEAFADAATGEFERLKEFGIKAKTEGDNVTFAWTENGKELTETVKKSSNEIRAFLLQTMGDRFSGAMDRQSKTWNGIMSNLGDSWVDFKRRIGDAGFFDKASGYLQKILDWIGKLDADGTLDKWAERFSDSLSSGLDFFALIAERVATNVGFLIENFERLEPILTPLGAAIALLITRAFPLMTLFTIIALAVDDFLSYLQGGESLIGDFIEKIQELTGVSETVAEAMAGLGAAVAAGLAGAFLISPAKMIKGFGRTLFKGLAALSPVILKGVISAFAILSNPLGWSLIVAGAGAALVYYFWDEIKAAWDASSAFASEVFSSLKGWILDINWSTIGVDLIQAMLDGIELSSRNIIIWFLGLREKIVAAIGNIDLGDFIQWPEPPAWWKAIFGSDEDVAKPNPNIGSVKPTGRVQTDKPLPSGQSGSVSMTDEALDYKFQLQNQAWEKFTGNLNDNLKKLAPEEAITATVTDARQDNRQSPINSNVTVNQTVNGASQAPRAAANATGTAVAGAVVKQRSQLEVEPSF